MNKIEEYYNSWHFRQGKWLHLAIEKAIITVSENRVKATYLASFLSLLYTCFKTDKLVIWFNYSLADEFH